MTKAPAPRSPAIDLTQWQFLAPEAPSCSICRGAHEPGDPHDPTGLQYRIAFFLRYLRFPTWSDAMAHCDAQTRQLWREELRGTLTALGQVIPEDLEAIHDEQPRADR